MNIFLTVHNYLEFFRCVGEDIERKEGEGRRKEGAGKSEEG
jgi:hypothetical protein